MLPTIAVIFTLAFTPSLRGSPASQAHQNAEADRSHLERFRDRAALERAIASGTLVPIVPTAAYELDPDIGSADPGHEALYAYARPWVKTFLDRELGAIHVATGIRFRITSLVRTAEYQRALVRGGNRAAIRGKQRWKRSSHLTGSTVDISWLKTDASIVALLKHRLIELKKRKLVEPVMEHYQACFHIMVFPRYAPARSH